MCPDHGLDSGLGVVDGDEPGQKIRIAHFQQEEILGRELPARGDCLVGRVPIMEGPC